MVLVDESEHHGDATKMIWTVAERQADRRGFNERDQEGAFDQTRRDTTTHSPVK